MFQLELPSDRAPLKLHDPDNSITFVSSPYEQTRQTGEALSQAWSENEDRVITTVIGGNVNQCQKKGEKELHEW